LIDAEAHRCQSISGLRRPAQGRQSQGEKQLNVNEGVADAKATGGRIIKGYERSNAFLSIEDHPA
jgi:hypothetical protein